MPVEVSKSLVIPDAELSWRFTPSGGPGGQHANRSHTRVELAWNVAESDVVTEPQRHRIEAKHGAVLSVTVDEERSQRRNRDIAEERMAEIIAKALVRKKKRRPTKPSAGAKRRRLQAKRRQSERKAQRRRPRLED